MQTITTTAACTTLSHHRSLMTTQSYRTPYNRGPPTTHVMLHSLTPIDNEQDSA